MEAAAFTLTPGQHYVQMDEKDSLPVQQNPLQTRIKKCNCNNEIINNCCLIFGGLASAALLFTSGYLMEIKMETLGWVAVGVAIGIALCCLCIHYPRNNSKNNT